MTARLTLIVASFALVGVTVVAGSLKDIDSKTLCQMYLAKGKPTYLDTEIEQELRKRPAPAPICTLPQFMNLVLSGAATVDSLFNK